MKHIKLYEEITRDELKALEDYADWLFAKIGVDIVFSNHFKSRINDARRGRPISYEEMVELFTKAYRQAGKEISELPINVSFVLRDIFSKINVPFVVERDPRNGERDVVLKTIIRKSNFQSTNPEITI